jgi:hypothetical protein
VTRAEQLVQPVQKEIKEMMVIREEQLEIQDLEDYREMLVE